jgi:hypothetical protein
MEGIIVEKPDDEIGRDKFGVPYSEYPKCPNEDCSRDNGIGLNYIGLHDDDNPHTRMDGGNTYYCYACCQTFN